MENKTWKMVSYLNKKIDLQWMKQPLKELIDNWNMKNKYYTPSIEDIRVGYELEYHNSMSDMIGDPKHNWSRWEATILKKGNVKNFMEYGIGRGVRVSYLTKEQIEAEGWKSANTGGVDKGFIDGIFGCSKGNYMMGVDFKPEIPIAHIMIMDCAKEHWYKTPEHFRCIFPCPSINELRYISKLLNIK